MPNVHTPQRLEGESREQYRNRQRSSRFTAKLGRNADTGEQVYLKGLGDNHKEPSQRQQMRDNARKNGRGPKGVFGAGIVAAAAKGLRDSKAFQLKHPRNADGAITFVGPKFELDGVEPTRAEFELGGGVHIDGTRFHTVRRIWLGGISAQRGY